MDILFIGKENDAYSASAADYLRERFPQAKIIFSSRTLKYPEELHSWEGDYIFSYLAQWIIPEKTLLGARRGALNWHPGPPEYPGIGCTNFAVYNQEKVFGMTCHQMLSKVDSGAIIEVRR